MTNDELNRKVAALRGLQWPDDHCPVCGWPFQPDHDDWEDGCIPGNCSTRPTPAIRAIDAAIPNYCDDPAAWGALFVALAQESSQAQILYIRGRIYPWGATIWNKHNMYEAADMSPGRALCLSYLIASGVDV